MEKKYFWRSHLSNVPLVIFLLVASYYTAMDYADTLLQYIGLLFLSGIIISVLTYPLLYKIWKKRNNK